MTPSFCFSPRSFHTCECGAPFMADGSTRILASNERGEKQKEGWFGFAAFYKQATPTGFGEVCAAWTRTGMSTKANAYVDGLTSGTRYWFSVAAVSPAGQGAWSEVVGGVAG
jgi:hypothetical protein